MLMMIIYLEKINKLSMKEMKEGLSWSLALTLDQ